MQLASSLLAVSWSFKLIFDFGLCTRCVEWAWHVDLHLSSSSPAWLRLHHVNRCGMLTYTSAELRLLSVTRCPPQRAVRKRLFTFQLWRPVRRRQMAWKSLQCVIPTSVPITHNNRPGSADRLPSITIGWLNAQSLRNKTDRIPATITDRSLVVLALTETWHTASDDNCLRLATPPGYAVIDAARSSHRGGGIAIIFRNNWKSALLTLPVCTTFEALAVRLSLSTVHFTILLVYRPGSEKVSSLFFDELCHSVHCVWKVDFIFKINFNTNKYVQRTKLKMSRYNNGRYIMV